MHKSYAGEGVSNHIQLFPKSESKNCSSFCHLTLYSALILSDKTRAESTSVLIKVYEILIYLLNISLVYTLMIEKNVTHNLPCWTAYPACSWIVWNISKRCPPCFHFAEMFLGPENYCVWKPRPPVSPPKW